MGLKLGHAIQKQRPGHVPGKHSPSKLRRFEPHGSQSRHYNVSQCCQVYIATRGRKKSEYRCTFWLNLWLCPLQRYGMGLKSIGAVFK